MGCSHKGFEMCESCPEAKADRAATEELQYEAKTGRLVAAILAKGWEITKEPGGTFSVLGQDQDGEWDVIALADTLDKVVRIALDEEND